MNSLLADIEPVLGFFPLTALMLAGCLWGLFMLTIAMKCHPRLSQHFILWGLFIVTAGSFVNLSSIPESENIEIPLSGSSTNEHEGATVSIDLDGIARMKHYRPDRTLYTTTTEEQTEERGAWEQLLLKAYPLFYQNTIQHIYYIGIICVLLYLIMQVIHLERIKKEAYEHCREDGAVIYRSHYTLPFSFGKSIFLPFNQSEENLQYILLHEKSHVRHKHFYKLCLLLLIAAFNWYNPFVWLLLTENKILQEMEADSDVMQQGCLPTEYQMNLIRMAIQGKEWIWIRSSYNHHPLKKRILFMNDSINLKQSRIITWLATIVFIVATGVILISNTDFINSTLTDRHKNGNSALYQETNGLYGSWHLEGTFTDSTRTHICKPIVDGYKFYGKDIALTVIVYKQPNASINSRFNASGKSYEIRQDSTVIENGSLLKYSINHGDELILTAYNPASTKGNTHGSSEKWRRLDKVPDGIRKIISGITAEGSLRHPFKGTWRMVSIQDVSNNTIINAAPHVYKVYNDDTYIIFHCTQFNRKGIDYSCEGHCGTFTYFTKESIAEQGNPVEMKWIDDNNYHLIYFDGKGYQKEHWEKYDLPPGIKSITEDITPVLQH